MEVFDQLESEVRSYCRTFPTVFTKACGHRIWDERGREFIDFFAGAGALNYGHNNPSLKDAMLEYIAADGVTHSLDMATVAKRDFLNAFQRIALAPRNMNYKVMFPGPTGTNSVEAALKIARTVTGRSNVIAFTNAFHGMTLGSLALTGNGGKRDAAGVSLTDVTRMPYHSYMGSDLDTIDLLEQHLNDTSSGLDLPAALILETVQAEGGVNVATNPWLRRLQSLLKRFEILLIVDDIQVGCGRTGPFFSFEPADLKPDIICLSKSLSGYGIPFAVTLLRPELDQWEPGKHNGTFRGHNLAFITATAALEHYWTDVNLSTNVKRRGKIVHDQLTKLAESHGGSVRGRGLIQGIEFAESEIAGRVSREAFDRGLIIETAGRQDEVLKILPPLTISDKALCEGLEIIGESVEATLAAMAAP
ncbi:MAG: diaminobutyrate--2-oxoglutarate transaminase [Planctomycetaceae bacterium]|nr:diaminobutyrate--2-oxoglutarate transaminase [Planctomycetales bacterium]MCB9923399.1 diaminobutyrate--2-oxoglutarate transaminase [Planctomycetaceae bacterium]